jgi:hypothetical protein
MSPMSISGVKDEKPGPRAQLDPGLARISDEPLSTGADTVCTENLIRID